MLEGEMKDSHLCDDVA